MAIIKLNRNTPKLVLNLANFVALNKLNCGSTIDANLTIESIGKLHHKHHYGRYSGSCVDIELPYDFILPYDYDCDEKDNSPILSYKALSINAGTIEFHFDDKLYKLHKGQYIAKLYVDDLYVTQFKVYLNDESTKIIQASIHQTTQCGD